MQGDELVDRVAAVRRFNRFYTRRIGVLHEGLLGSPFSLAEGRLVYELAHREPTTATELRAALGLDAGYLSRLLRGLEERGLLARRASDSDARQTLLSLTRKGRKAFDTIDARSREEIGDMLAALSAEDQRRLAAAMGSIEDLLGEGADRREPFVLRSHRPGDMGWVVQRHGALYAEEYGWDARFEALVAKIVAQFIETYDERREHCWIAERFREPVGSVFLVRESDEVARLRLLLVEPRARGLGIGERLTEECVSFARRAGYRKVTLWTNSVLTAARRIYERQGFVLVREERHHSFGKDLVGQTFDLAL